MAIYHCSMKPISRGTGKSIVAAAAYRHTCKLEDSRTGAVYDYSRKQGLESSRIYLPSGVKSEWAQDRSQLWNAVEAAEKRKDARLGRELVLALPTELTKEQRKELTGEMARHLADRYGLAVDVAIHQPGSDGDQRNHHAHILMSSRRITPDGFGVKARELDDHDRGPIEIEHIRAEWARLANRALERAGQHVQIDHRSFQRRGIKRMPTLHLGPSATAMERRGDETRIGNRNRAAQALNTQVGELERECLAAGNESDRERSYAAWAEKTRQADPDAWERAEKMMDMEGRSKEYDSTAMAAAAEVRAAKSALGQHEWREARQGFFQKIWNGRRNEAERQKLVERLDEANRHWDNASAQVKTSEELVVDARRASEERRAAWESSPEWRACEERCRNRTVRELDVAKEIDRQAAEARRAREERTWNRLLRRHLAPLLRTIVEKKQTQEQTRPRLAPKLQPSSSLPNRTERAIAVAERFRPRLVSVGSWMTQDIPMEQLGPKTPEVPEEKRTREPERTVQAPSLEEQAPKRTEPSKLEVPSFEKKPEAEINAGIQAARQRFHMEKATRAAAKAEAEERERRRKQQEAERERKRQAERAELEKQYGQAVCMLVCPQSLSAARSRTEYGRYLDRLQAATPEQRAEMVKELRHAEQRYGAQELFYSLAKLVSGDTSISGRQKMRDTMLKEWDGATPERRKQMELEAKEYVKTHEHERQRSRDMSMGR